MRFLYMILVGIVIGFLLDALLPGNTENSNALMHHLTSVFITILVWEGNLRIDSFYNIKFPWLKMPAKRILIQAITCIVYSAFTIFLSMLFFDNYVCKIPNTSREQLMFSSTILGLIITVILISIEIGSQFFVNWKASIIEVEKYRTESAQAQLQNLKEQINPHFLFNNLSVLSSLVYKDQDKAVDFINQLSKVYRYLLDSKNTELISLEDELTFIKSYLYLLEIRFDTNIHFDIQIPQQSLNLFLPPMALQMLVENAIKHNEVSAEMPLTVLILAQNETIEVKNNLQARIHQEESSKTGLNNIRERYKHYTERKVEVINDHKNFVVRIPLLAQSL